MSVSYEIYWDELKKELEKTLNESEMFMLINRLSYKSFDGSKNLLILNAPSNFIKDNISKHYLNLMNTTLSQISGLNNSCIELIVEQKPQKNGLSSIEQIKPTKENPNLKNEVEVKPIQHKEEYTSNSKIDQDENYSFESFIIGNSNEFAAASAKVVAESPGKTYNPYFLWGESGLGKTHLLKSIGKKVKELYPSKKIRYVTSEEFTNDFVYSIRVNNPDSFRSKYRSLDVLLLDDVQFFSDKEGIQQEFFNTFNKLYDEGKQMVFSCDRPISKVKKMEDRIKSRFAMGLTVDLRPPDYELKMAILKDMAENYGLRFENNAIEYICTNINGNIREIKGAFRDLYAYSSIMKIKDITIEIVIDRLKEKITTNMLSTNISVDKIIRIVGEYYDITTSDLIGNKRTKSIVTARQIAMYISRKSTRLSTTQIGAYFGNKEHGTVMHATKKIEDLIINDPKIKGDVINLLNRVKSEE